MRRVLERWTAAGLELPAIPALATLLLIAGGLFVAPFDWQVGGVERSPVAVDALPDTGDNQQIVYTSWPGRSPQDVEDQITYPLTAALLGVPGVRALRSSSMFGASTINVIFDDGRDFYDSRSRLVERLASLDAGVLPSDARPTLGPDATALGQVFWYTLEGRTPEGEAAGGWDLGELRTIQDWTLKNALSSVPGVAEVASIGGYVEEFQIDVDPAKLLAHGISLAQVFDGVRASNVDIGARTLEINRAEYVVRGLGRLETLADLESVVLRATDGIPITLRQVADIYRGPAPRRGALDNAGTEAVGAVIVARFGSNPMEVIQAVKTRIAELAGSLPSKELEDGTTSRVTIVPFYDRSQLIDETLGTLSEALRNQVLLTAIVILAMLGHMRSALLVAGLVPLAVLATFLGMRLLGVEANVVALAGIAIAIGTLVDMGIVLTENILQHLSPGQSRAERRAAIAAATSEVGSAMLTAILTTVVGFLPVFTLQGPEGKLFEPLAATKTLALIASIVLALGIVPAAAATLLRPRGPSTRGVQGILFTRALCLAGLIGFGWAWAPAGPSRPIVGALFGVLIPGGFLLLFSALQRAYAPMLRWCLAHKLLFLCAPLLLLFGGLTVWLGAGRTLGFLPNAALNSSVGRSVTGAFPGLGREFLPRFDEGTFLLMPVTIPSASIGEALELMQIQNARIAALPEVQTVVGKIGRVESALDPAPISMVETVIQLEPEFGTDEDGERVRHWRPAIASPADIWDEIARAAQVPGMTTASMLQPIETRRIMLQTGLRAPMGVKVYGHSLEDLEVALNRIEPVLAAIPGVQAASVFADQVAGKPYLEIDLDREALARHGLSISKVQAVIGVAVGGAELTTVQAGRERFAVRARYSRELRETPEDLAAVLVPTPGGAQIPLGQLAQLRLARGPQVIRSEDSFLVGHVLFDALPGKGAVDVALGAKAALEAARDRGDLVLPAGVHFRFAGEYENQMRAAATLRVVLPVSLALIFLLLYMLLRRVAAALIVFSAVFVAWSGGFLLLGLYGIPGFLDFELAGVHIGDLFGVRPVNLSVAVWVGFLALFGIATDDGVILSTYLRQSLTELAPSSRAEVRQAVVEAGLRRVRPCLMTTATTTLALLPVLSSKGKGADILGPMAIPTFGGMLVVLITLFLVPTLVSALEESKLAPCETP